MRKRLSIKRINAWLDEQGGAERALAPADLISGGDSYIRFVYALLYGDSRKDFGYRIEEDDEAENTEARAAGFVVPDVRFRKEGT
jgi:hypothetical protein